MADHRYPLGSLGLQIKAHWKEHRPKMFKALEQAGQLEASVHAAQELTADALSDLLDQGLPYNQAWELVREEWAFLPSEDNVPVLPFDPITLEYEQA